MSRAASRPVVAPSALDSPAEAPGWRAELLHRVVHLLPLKIAGVTGLTWVFFIAYFHLLRFPAHAVTVMPLTALDRWVAFEPAALPAYLSLWVYVGIAPGLQRRFDQLVVYGLWIGALCLTGLACFYLWPTAVPRPALDPGGFPGFATLQGVDAAGNACPSMHVAVAVFSAIWVDRQFAWIGSPRAFRAVNAVWAVAIVWSTLATRQHVALDALAGALLGSAFAAASLRWRPGAGRRGGVAIIGPR